MKTPGNIRLITMPMSHYCEKARWGLERLNIPYYEERHLQGFHYPRTYLVSKGPNVPVLIDDKQVIVDSTTILKHLDQYASPEMRLYPDDTAERARVDEMEDLFDEVLGVESRRWVYHHFQRHPFQALRTAGQGAPNIEKILMPLAFPFVMSLIKTVLKPSKINVGNGLEKIRGIIKKTDQMLSDKRPYLLGSNFTAADLTLACMLAPLVLPENYGIRLPTIDEMPVAAHSAITEFRNTDTGNYVLQLYKNERPCPSWLL